MTPPAETITKPSETTVVGDPPPQASGIELPTITVFDTRIESIENIKHLLSDRPLHRPNRTRPIEDIEDELDIAAFEARKDDPGVPWEQVKGELGL